MKIKYIALAISSVSLAGSLLTIANAITNQSFKATLTINKPNTTFTIGDASGQVDYKDSLQTTTLSGSLNASQVASMATYTIAFINTSQTNRYHKGIELTGNVGTDKNVIGAVINSMVWNDSSKIPLKFAAASGSCDLGSGDTSITFNSNSGSCSMSISGKQLEKITSNGAKASYNTTTAPNVYGTFSQNITYTVSMT